MTRPVLVIMAAGMGSRYGGLKQIDPIDADGHIIMDYSVFDAVRAGFRDVIFIIKKENEQSFRSAIGDRLARRVGVHYAFQSLEDIPEGFAVPEGRVKPWGTGHAVRSCRELIRGPFAVINADDYYGPEAFHQIYQYLSSHPDDDKFRYAMVGYILGNTLTENGHVSRGICQVDAQGYLEKIQERTYIVRTEDGAAYSEDDGESFTAVAADSCVSMNMWGFTESIMRELEEGFTRFFREEVPADPMKAEYYLPTAAGALVRTGQASVKVLPSTDRWYGMTYKEDKKMVEQAMKELKKKGVYPGHLWA